MKRSESSLVRFKVGQLGRLGRSTFNYVLMHYSVSFSWYASIFFIFNFLRDKSCNGGHHRTIDSCIKELLFSLLAEGLAWFVPQRVCTIACLFSARTPVFLSLCYFILLLPGWCHLEFPINGHSTSEVTSHMLPVARGRSFFHKTHYAP